VKNKRLIITTIIFFLLVNTAYYWEGKLGLFAFPAFTLLAIVYAGLAIVLFRQIYFLIKEKFSVRQRLFRAGLLTIVLALVFYKPFGLIDFDKLEGADLLIAEREGSANCRTTFKLKVNNKFTEKTICFGITEIKGDYKLENDTIFFENVVAGRGENEVCKFAVIRPSIFNKDGKHFDLIRFKDLNDTTGYELWITKNDLYNPTDKKSNR